MVFPARRGLGAEESMVHRESQGILETTGSRRAVDSNVEPEHSRIHIDG